MVRFNDRLPTVLCTRRHVSPVLNVLFTSSYTASAGLMHVSNPRRYPILGVWRESLTAAGRYAVRHLHIKSQRIGVQRLGMQSYTCAIADAAAAVKFQTQIALAGHTKLGVASK